MHYFVMKIPKTEYLERILKLIMTIDKIRVEKVQYNINRETAKISLGKTDKYEFLTGEKILPSDQSKIIEEAKFTYSPLSKAFEKTNKKPLKIKE